MFLVCVQCTVSVQSAVSVEVGLTVGRKARIVILVQSAVLVCQLSLSSSQVLTTLSDHCHYQTNTGMATLQTNPLHQESDDEPITDLQGGTPRPANLGVIKADSENIGQSWSGGLGQGCAPAFQPFGSPSE